MSSALTACAPAGIARSPRVDPSATAILLGPQNANLACACTTEHLTDTDGTTREVVEQVCDRHREGELL